MLGNEYNFVKSGLLFPPSLLNWMEMKLYFQSLSYPFSSQISNENSKHLMSLFSLLFFPISEKLQRSLLNGELQRSTLSFTIELLMTPLMHHLDWRKGKDIRAKWFPSLSFWIRNRRKIKERIIYCFEREMKGKEKKWS